MGQWKLIGSGLILGALAACGAGGSSGDEPRQPAEREAQGLKAGGQVLFVVGNPVLSPNDAAIKSRLQGLGGNVTVRAGSAAATADATGKTLIVISESVTSADVNTKFKNSAVPVLCLEPALFDDFGLTGTINGTDFGTTAGQTDIELISPAPLLAGATIPIAASAGTFAWGKPAASATRIAGIVGSPDHVAIFGYDAGQALVTGTAPARRVGWPATGDVALSSHGWKLFDAAVQWLTPADNNAELNLALKNLNGFVYKNPCHFGSNGPITDLTGCSAGDICWATSDLGHFTESQSISIGGPVGRVYEVDLNVLGVLEPRDYPAPPNCTLLAPGSSSAAPEQCSDGRANVSSVTFNIFELGVPGTAGKFYLNGVPTHPPHRVDKVDANLTITVNAGSTLQFNFDDLNGGQIRNCSTIVTASAFTRSPSSPFGAAPIAAPASLPQPYNGQWFQLSVLGARVKN